MGGRVAEELIFQQLTTGASNDIQVATDLARKMVCDWGMSDKLGPLHFGKREGEVFLGRDFGDGGKEYSEQTAIEIDAGSLEHGLRQVDYLNKRSRQLEHFIRHGATSNMLTKLFKISSADVTLKRRLFSGTASSLRRPAMPTHPVREQIVKRWFEIRKGKEREPERAEDYQELHAYFSQHTFATLYAVVHEFDE